jgi:hypothetical protein
MARPELLPLRNQIAFQKVVVSDVAWRQDQVPGASPAPIKLIQGVFG